MFEQQCRFKPGFDAAKADAWAAAVVTFILVMGNPPITIATQGCWFYRQIAANKWSKFWEAHEKYGPTLRPECKAFFERALNVNMAARPSVEQMMSDPWLKGPGLTSEELSTYMDSAMCNDE
eukprot:FR735631.1.p1 GENE.FR735631.1~~FR735631.1.p1  ORF type:complete len:122 (+),score=8.99 FR735631.1:205-570(+)